MIQSLHHLPVSLVDQSDYPALLELWDASVRASHHFLEDKDVAFLRPIILNNAFPNVELRCVRNSDAEILGFIGVAERSVEMLFISPCYFGMGFGKFLMDFAESHFGTYLVDVNEQNLKALEFYEKLGYKIISRSPLDGQGNPFPILHMELPASNRCMQVNR